MAERKVLNRYYPPDYDPGKVPGGTGIRHANRTVRVMAPYTMRCNVCGKIHSKVLKGEYIYARKKFNARKETVRDEDYLGIEIFRFFIKCPRCASEITYKTDPKNTDYVAEHGGTRNFEPWRDEKFIEAEIKEEQQLEDDANPMKALEARTIESKKEMDILEYLDDIRTVNARAEKVNPDDVLVKIAEARKRKKVEVKSKEEEEDNLLTTAMFHSIDGDYVKPVLDHEPITVSKPVGTLDVTKKTTGLESLVKKTNGLESLVKKPIVVAKPIVTKRKLNGLATLNAYADSDESE